jgi:hypothetical protein
MTAMTAADWDGIVALARRTGFPEERVLTARRRIEDPGAGAGRPYTLIVGRPNCGIELLTARWLGPEAAESLIVEVDRPLIVGPDPQAAQPRLGRWRAISHPVPRGGHLILLRTSGRPSSEVLAQLASLGGIERMVLVVSLTQPMHMHEREIAATCSPLAASARALAIGVSGHEPKQSELIELAANMRVHLRNAGFGPARCGPTGTWFTGGAAREGAVKDVGEFILGGDPPGEAAKRELAAQTVASVLSEIARSDARKPVSDATVVPEVEQDRLTREFAAYLADLGRELERRACDRRRPADAAVLRKHALDAVRGWESYLGVEGHWMKYVERLRPGAHLALLGETEAALADLEFDPGVEEHPSPAPCDPADRWKPLAQQAGAGIGLGLAGYYASAALLSSVGTVPMPMPLIQAISVGGFLGAGLFGYRAFGRLVRQPAIQPACQAARPASLIGWDRVQRRLAAWVRSYLATAPLSPADECKALSLRLGVTEMVS